MYPSNGGPMAPPQKPETFMLSNEAQQSLPQDAQVALQQVDNRTSCSNQSCDWEYIASHQGLTVTYSQIFLNLSTCRLDARLPHPTLSPPNWRIRVLCSMVCSVAVSHQIRSNGIQGTTSSIFRGQISYDAFPSAFKRLAGQ
jgi:hypothetical protein